MIGALWYLIWRGFATRGARLLTRIRQPRYAIAILFGVLWLLFVFVQPFGPPPTPRLPSGIPIATGLNPTASGLIGVTLGITVILWWLRGGVATALAFQPAEAHFLFPAPIPRRVLIAYRIVRSQIVLLINALIWMGLVRRWGVSLSPLERYASAWVFFSFLSLHRLATALVQTEPVIGARRAILYVGRTLAGAAAVALVASALPVIGTFSTQGAVAGFAALQSAVAHPPASYALALFRTVTAPISAPSQAVWQHAFLVGLAIVFVHVAWILAMDVEFEEAAVAASVDLARRVAAVRSRRGGMALLKPGKIKRTTRLPLSPTGPAVLAIVWKNTIGFLRSEGVRSLFFFVSLMAVMPIVIRFLPARSGTDALELGLIGLMPGFFLMFMTFMVGPRLLRHDLRYDLLSLSVIKTYPLRGLDIVAGELVSPTVALTAVHVVAVLVVALASPPAFRAAIGTTHVLMAVLVAPMVFLALNSANLTIQNGAALMFPAWVRLGPDSGGVETIGQNLLFTIGAMIVLMVSVFIPVLWGAIAWGITRPFIGEWSLAAGTVAGAAALFTEVGFMVVRLGKVLERTEPSAVG